MPDSRPMTDRERVSRNEHSPKSPLWHRDRYQALEMAARRVVDRCGEETDDEGWTMAWVDAEALAALKAVLDA